MFYIGTIITLLLLFLWFRFPNFTEWEPLIGGWVVLQGLVIYGQNRKIESLEYSPSIPLALGYINNFIEPVIGELLKKHSNPTIFIYMPEDISELSPKSIERIKIRIEQMNLSFRKTSIEIGSKGRMRSCFEVKSIDGQKVFFFDFPETLKSLEDYIDYKLESRRNHFIKGDKKIMGKRLIDQFHATVIELLKEKDIDGHIKFVNKNLNFEL